LRGRDDSRDSVIAKEYSKKSSFARHAQSPNSIGQSAFGEGAASPSRRAFDRTGIVNASRASGSRKSVSASSRNPQAGSPRSPEEDPAAATVSERASRIEKDFMHRKSTISISYHDV